MEDHSDDDDYTHNVATTGQRTKRDIGEGRLVTSLKQHGVFHNKSQTPQNIMNKDVVIATIQESQLGAERLARNSWMSMCEPPESEHSIKALIHMNDGQALLRALVKLPNTKILRTM